jgi:hypothetical protein
MTRRYVMLVSNTVGNAPTSIHESFDAAKAAARSYLLGRDDKSSLSSQERARIKAELAALSADSVSYVRGRTGWNELIYIAPLK